MLPLISILGFNFDSSTMLSLGAVGLGFIMGFVIGSALRHSFKIIAVIMGVLVVVGLLAPSAVQTAMGTLALVDPTLWIKEILGVATASFAVLFLFIGLAVGIWKG